MKRIIWVLKWLRLIFVLCLIAVFSYWVVWQIESVIELFTNN